jgi:DNA-binding protein YbaB
MTGETHPQVAEAMRQMQRFQSALDDQMRRAGTELFMATDESESVEVTLNGQRLITGLEIEDGLLRLGPGVVGHRINEALRNSQAVAGTALEAENQRLVGVLTDIASSLMDTLNSG